MLLNLYTLHFLSLILYTLFTSQPPFKHSLQRLNWAPYLEKRQFFSNKTMNIWVNFPRMGKMVKIWYFLVFKKKLFFQLISTVLKRFWPGNYKNVFVLVLAHLKPELELFEVDDVGDDGDGQNLFRTAEKS